MSIASRELDNPVGEVAAALAAIAEAWEAEWTPAPAGGRLALPVVHGLRRGVESGEVRLTPLGAARCRLDWTLGDSRLVVDRSSVAVLSFAAVPLVVTVAWPFWPALFALVPFAAVTGLLAWWLVVSRLRSRGPEEFFAELARALAPPPAGESGDRVIR
ncbi:MAG: hypothetical protein NDJ75_03745 [Thermoanaerobaculia bacterium]|nr:hypothetical protein [Thermoanaerobaculia bacterium]